MNSTIQKIRDRLCIYSGEDYAIIRKCNTKIQFYFSVIGGFVMAILLCCFISAYFFTDHLFNSIFLDFGVALVWGYIVTNMYLLLLYTISPTILPLKQRHKNNNKIELPIYNISFLLRIILIILLAIVTAQPLNILILRPFTTTYAQDIKLLLSNNSISWLITFFVCCIFLLPIYLKYSIRKFGDFYEKKAEIEKRIIEDDYTEFKNHYNHLLEQNISKYNKSVWEGVLPYLNKLDKIEATNQNRHFTEIKEELVNENPEKYEYWADPPFRTTRKIKFNTPNTEQDFLNDIYNN